MHSSDQPEDQSWRHLVEQLEPLAREATSRTALDTLFEAKYKHKPTGTEIFALDEAWNRCIRRVLVTGARSQPSN